MSNPAIFHIGSYDETAKVIENVLQRPGTADMLDQLHKSNNPLIVVKPNWIQEAHEYIPDVWIPVITNPSLIMAICDSLAELIEGKGTIALCDAPHTYADFEKILARGGLQSRVQELKDKWPMLRFEIIDLRREVWIRKEEVVVSRVPNPDDPRGYVAFNLGRQSLFYGHLGEGSYYGADYDTDVVNRHHQGEVQEYLLAGTPAKCDLFVNVPKLKTHKKTGITCCLKNLVGINGDKNWLPHHTEGAPPQGDEYPKEAFANVLETRFKKLGRKLALGLPGVGTWVYRKARNAGKRVLGDSETTVRNGNWMGNDTCWRMALDLNRALLYGNPDGSWRERGEAKPYLAFVDGIVGGEGNGPLCPDEVDSQVLLAGDDPAELDAVAVRLMGYDPVDFPIVYHAFDEHRWPIARVPMLDISVWDEREGKIVGLYDVKPAVPQGFKLHFGWSSLPKTT